MSAIKGIVIRNIKVPLTGSFADHDLAAIYKARKLAVKSHIPLDFEDKDLSVYKKSVDARKKDEICFVYSVLISTDFVTFDIKQLDRLYECCKKNGFAVLDEIGLEYEYGTERADFRPVVAGFGPCGMFCALVLARAGFRPIVLERGEDVDSRAKSVSEYWEKGNLNPHSNVQFGEGGAGTFSDGKLLTRINNRYCSFVLDTFYRFGADRDILTNAKPHIGTDKLRIIVKNMRNEIISLGGEVHFNTTLSGFLFDSAGRLNAVRTTKGDFTAKSVFLALGHSARDSFEMLMKGGFDIRPKAFSVGVRVEHLQENINKALYGKEYLNPALPQGEYALSKRVGDRAVYSFCMCPGGTVVASASADGEIVTNGMSYSARDGKNANSAIAVSVLEKDYGSSVFGAIQYQQRIENAAFRLAGDDGSAPYQTMGDFLGTTKNSLSTDVLPTYTGKISRCNIAEIFPGYITEMLKDGFASFNSRIEGFSADSTIITGPETRTSSPVRIVRNDKFQAPHYDGIYPCGEGAGYAGGITSAAVDGIKCAIEFISRYKL